MTSPEAAVHNFFRRNHNHFRGAGAGRRGVLGRAQRATDDVYAEVKAALRDRLGLRVRLVRVEDMPDTLREYDEAARVLLSEALDHPNRVFQLVHVAGLSRTAGCFDGSWPAPTSPTRTASRAAGSNSPITSPPRC
jgi:predicted transcriptional regulator